MAKHLSLTENVFFFCFHLHSAHFIHTEKYITKTTTFYSLVWSKWKQIAFKRKALYSSTWQIVLLPLNSFSASFCFILCTKIYHNHPPHSIHSLLPRYSFWFWLFTGSSPFSHFIFILHKTLPSTTTTTNTLH